MINFIYGRSADAKLKYITDMIAKDHEGGIRSFLIVPEQFAVHSERQMLRALPSSAQLTLEVLNFSRLYNRVCREYGGLEYNYITKPLKYAMMWQNMRELAPLLTVYGKYTDNTASLCDMMLAAVGEFKGCGVSAASLEAAAKKLDADDPLTEKLRDLALIYASFDNLVSHTFSDSADDISKLCDVLQKHDFFAGANVYIDSFTSFTAVEYKIIDKIFESAANVSVTIPLDVPRADSIYAKSIIECEARLSKGAKAHGEHIETVLSEATQKQSEDIALLSENLWTTNIQNVKKKGLSDSVRLFKCSSPYTEAEAAAAAVLSLLREGKRCRDVVVLARDAETYRGIIEPAFERCSIPYHFSEKTDLSSTPLVKFILSALRIGIYNWRTEDVISHLKCALYDIDTADIDLFEQYITTWQVRGARFTSGDFKMNPDGYVKEPSKRGEKILSAANRTRERLCNSLLSLFDDIEGAEVAADKIRAVYRFVASSGAKARLFELSKKEEKNKNARAAEEYSRLYATTCDALAELAEAMVADDSFASDLSLSDLYELLSVYFSKTDIGSIPSSADQVIIGSASMMRAGTPKCVLILGLCDGVFPAPVSDTGLLTFHEKSVLSQLDIDLSGDIDLVASDELMYLQRAVDSATEKLYLFSYATSTDGRKATPSLPFERASRIFADSLSSFDGKDIVALTPSLRASVQYLDKIDDEGVKQALRDCIAADGELCALVNKEHSPVSDVECSVDVDTANKVFGEELWLTQSRIDKFVNCSFSYYCTYVLKLREEQISRFKANDIGNFIHHILEKLLSKIVTENGIDSELSIEKIKQMTAEVVDSYISDINPPGMPITARLGHLYERLNKLSLLLVCNIIEEFRHSTFRPEFFELKIDGKDEHPSAYEFELNDGRKVVFSGIIDRVDILRKDDGKVYIRVVDYKTGTKQFSLEDIKHGLNVQMLLYLFALINNKNEVFNKHIGGEETEAAGVVYLSSNSPMLELEDYKDSESVFEAAQDNLTRSGLFLDDEDVLTAMNDTLSPKFLTGIKKKPETSYVSTERFKILEGELDSTIRRIANEMLSGKADASPLKYNEIDPCKYCAMKPICRRDQNGGKEMK